MTHQSLKSILYVLTLTLFAHVLYAQKQDFRFNYLTTEDGLSQSNITCILQDSLGFMWFGTFNGLNRYDGYTFKNYHYEPWNENSLSHNYISALIEDRNGFLWIGTRDGLMRFDPGLNRFEKFKHNEQDAAGTLSDNAVEAILEDHDGRIWIGTRNGGLNLFESANHAFVHYKQALTGAPGLSSNSIRTLFADHQGNIWIGHWNGSVDVLPSGKAANSKEILRSKISESVITQIVESDGKIWITTQGDGLYQVQILKDKISETGHLTARPFASDGLSSDILLCMMKDRQERLWIGTEDQGICLLDPETMHFRTIKKDPFNEHSLNHNSIWQIYQDKAGTIWIGTYAHGINFLTDQNTYFKHFKYFPGKKNCIANNMVTAFAEDDNHNLWIATDGGGLSFYDRKNKTFVQFNTKNSNLKSDVLVSLLWDSRNRLWIGTWTDGLFLFDKKSRSFKQFTMKSHGLASNRILHITDARDGGLWLSTYWGGLTYFNPDKGRVKIFNSGNSALTDNFVRTTLLDANGFLWIGTDDGISVYQPHKQSIINYQHDENDSTSISKGFIHTIVQTKDSTIWIGTTSGLNKYENKGRFVHFNTHDGLPNNEIKCIVEDRDGILWLSTNKGISQFDTKSGIFKNYDYADGLQGNEFNIRSGLRTAEGEILFGGNNGFNLFRYPILKNNDYIPPVLITDLKIFNKSVAIGSKDPVLNVHVSVAKKIHLSYSHSVVSFEFVALNYDVPERNQYAYKMEGFEEDWNYVGNRRIATYTNLAPGNYVFRVKASNNNGIWNERGAALQVLVEPPFWKTWWAYLIEFVLGIALISIILNYFIVRQRLRSALKMEHLELEKMYEMDQAKSQFFSNIAHEFYSPLTLILSPVQNLLKSEIENDRIKNSISLIYRNAQRLLRMINQLKDFHKFEAGSQLLNLSKGDIVKFCSHTVHSFNDYADTRNISLKFTAEPKIAVEWFDPDKLDKIIYNLLSNAFKFTPDYGEVQVFLSIQDPSVNKQSGPLNQNNIRRVEIKVCDSGIGIPQEQISHIFERYYRAENGSKSTVEGSGIGLAYVKELVQLYSGEISVKSSDEKGSEFKIVLPLDADYLEENQLVANFNIAAYGWERGYGDSDSLQPSGQNILPEPITPAVDIPVILVVEDDKEIRDYIRSALENNYRVIVADNGRKGLNKALRAIPDLIISDIMMPEMDGKELCRQIKNDERTNHIPFILLTAITDEAIKIDGLQKGADVYLTKPFSVDELEAHLINLLQSRRRLRAKYSRSIMLDNKRNRLNNQDEDFLERVIQIIENNISNTDLNADLVSQKMNMSRMQLYRKLRGLTNQTAHEFIRNVRLRKAIRLLKENRMTITEVAYEVGFNDLSYFARCFRKQFNTSPSEYIAKK